MWFRTTRNQHHMNPKFVLEAHQFLKLSLQKAAVYVMLFYLLSNDLFYNVSRILSLHYLTTPSLGV